jgi:hypothetical protein
LKTGHTRNRRKKRRDKCKHRGGNYDDDYKRHRHVLSEKKWRYSYRLLRRASVKREQWSMTWRLKVGKRRRKIRLLSGTVNTFLQHEKERGKQCFLCNPCWGYITGTNRTEAYKSLVEAGSNTSTVALRVVGGNEKGTQCLEV